MKEKIKEIKNLLKENQLEKVETFISILSSLELSDENILSGLLYYCVINNKLTLNQVKETNDDKIFNTVSTLLKLDDINFNQQVEEAENLRKMFFAITKDIRIIMIKIAYILAELRHVENSNFEITALTNSIFYLYAPLAARLGLNEIKTELENSAFKLSNPDLYNKIQQDVDNKFHKRQPIVERLTKLVENCLKELNIDGRVYGRKKHIYSIYKKIEDKGIENIYDLIAVRAIVKTIPECYALIGRYTHLLNHTKIVLKII